MKSKPFAVLAVVVLMAALAWGGQGQPSQSGQISWEYQVVPVSTVARGEQVLREMGEKGWELAGVQTLLTPRVMPAQQADARSGDTGSALYFFKRRK